VRGIPVPTHLFVVLAKCAAKSMSLPCWNHLHLLSFLIPHVPTPSNCQVSFVVIIMCNL
jgi:hypothetical protein